MKYIMNRQTDRPTLKMWKRELKQKFWLLSAFSQSFLQEGKQRVLNCTTFCRYIIVLFVTSLQGNILRRVSFDGSSRQCA
jgi:hypothetical protein